MLLKILKIQIVFIIFLNSIQLEAQKTDLPFYTIPEYPEKITEAAILQRTIDGLGFRYFWATDGLTKKDLDFKASENGRTSFETLEHIFGLSNVILNAFEKSPNKKQEKVEMSYEDLRAATLNNLYKASQILQKTEKVDDFLIIFERDGNNSTFPIWNLINGPIEDAIWHCGQVVTLRRASDNPINPKVNVFLGKLMD
ncbi:hypothetical protein [Namhaeicola litoreus]|uniref:DinB family protein n=1 Tax=Namhaeicola litoreus TaxID=1052145 RepID=A0ABW3Y4S8_9FLAO